MPFSPQPDSDSAGHRQSGRPRKPTAKVAELLQRQAEDEETRQVDAAAAAARAGKRARPYSTEQLEELMDEHNDKRQRLESANEHSTSKEVPDSPSLQDRLPLPPPSRYQRAGVNLGYVDRMRESHANLLSLPTQNDSLHHISSVNPKAPIQRQTTLPPSVGQFSRPVTQESNDPSRSPDNARVTPATRPTGMNIPRANSVSPFSSSLGSPAARVVTLFPPSTPRANTSALNNAVNGDHSGGPLMDPGTHSHPQGSPAIDDLQRHYSSANQDSSESSRGSSPATTPLHPNDDPSSTTYGDGEGKLLPPRRVVVRQLEALTGKTREEKRRARNLVRPKAADYMRTETQMLQTATTRMVALCSCLDPFPFSQQETALAEECWDWARGFHQKRITHTKDIIALLKRNVGGQKSQFAIAAAELIKERYRFTTTDDPNNASADFNSAMANTLLADNSFVFGDVDEREDPYCNGLIKALFLKIWFKDHRSAGVKHSEVFFPLRTTPIAFLVTLLEKAIREWVPGVPQPIALEGTQFRDVLYEHTKSICDYRDYPGAKAIYEDIIADLEEAARRKSRQVAPPSFKSEDNHDDELILSTARHGVTTADIERALQKRRRHRNGNGATDVLLSDQTSATSAFPEPVLESGLVPQLELEPELQLRPAEGFTEPYTTSSNSNDEDYSYPL